MRFRPGKHAWTSGQCSGWQCAVCTMEYGNYCTGSVWHTHLDIQQSRKLDEHGIANALFSFLAKIPDELGSGMIMHPFYHSSFKG